MTCEKLVLILGDQLDRQSAVLVATSRAKDCILMIEARNESERIWSHKMRSSLFLAAMRHHASWLQEQRFRVDYINIDRPEAADFSTALQTAINRHKPRQLLMIEAGEHAVQEEIKQACDLAQLPVETMPDSHFLCSREQFVDWRNGRRNLVMEHYYRHMRKRYNILMQDGKPAGGKWNYDQQNRKGFGRAGPGFLTQLPSYQPDTTSSQAIKDVAQHFPDNPGSLENFIWPTTRDQALDMLDNFVTQRLVNFGPFQDAMWLGKPLLSHSGISAALNLKLLNPREVIDAACQAYSAGHAPIQSVEGFVRQILGWREYIHGIYWSEMPGYTESNALAAQLPLPGFYWNADTDMQCLREVIQQTLDFGYAHHIQRLMVTGLFALLLGVKPHEVHKWYLAMYIDAVEWVEAPNTLGMSQFADGGVMASKPYAASGRYIQRMSNYCSGCRYAPAQATGDQACPFTTLYWDFLNRHQQRFADHPRAGMQWRMLQRLDKTELVKIRKQAVRLQKTLID
jgi:deoxyribodipyrimidine photolyase-related protein